MTACPATASAESGPRERRSATLRPEMIDQGQQRSCRLRISAIVTTLNEADRIAECLESLAWCDEILVVDSHSTDGTREIARRYDRVRVLRRTYLGAASQKNWAIDRSRHDWILILDADERVTPELRREIERILAAPAAAVAYSIRRRTYAMGGEVRFSLAARQGGTPLPSRRSALPEPPCAR